MLNMVTRLLKAKPNTSCGDCAAREKYTLMNAAVDTLRGDYATDAVREERMAVCKSCEYLVLGSNCKLCGCFVHLKTRYAAASCDIHRW